jgi:hypothetical protein
VDDKFSRSSASGNLPAFDADDQTNATFEQSARDSHRDDRTDYGSLLVDPRAPCANQLVPRCGALSLADRRATSQRRLFKAGANAASRVRDGGMTHSSQIVAVVFLGKTSARKSDTEMRNAAGD